MEISSNGCFPRYTLEVGTPPFKKWWWTFWMMTNPYYKKWWFGNQPIENGGKGLLGLPQVWIEHAEHAIFYANPRQDFYRAMADALQEIVEIDAEQVGMTEAIGTWAMKKGPLVICCIYRGWNPTEFCGDYFIKHYKDPVIQDSMESIRGFFCGALGCRENYSTNTLKSFARQFCKRDPFLGW